MERSFILKELDLLKKKKIKTNKKKTLEFVSQITQETHNQKEII